MSRLVNAVLFVFVLIGVFWLYQVKHEAKDEEQKIVELRQEIQKERDALLLLKAEWSYINRPQRVQQLADEFSKELALQPIEPYQVGDLADVPERPAANEISGPMMNDIEDLLENAHKTSARVGMGGNGG